MPTFSSRLSFSLFGCLFLLVGCSVSKLQNKGSVQPVDFYTKVPFTYVKGLVGLDVEIEGEKRLFLFDTGADVSVIQRDTTQGRTGNYGGASKQKMELGNEIVPSMRIGEVSFLETYAVNGNLRGLQEPIPNFGGLIGQPIIRKANWLIDYPNQTVEISNKDLYDESFVSFEVVREGGYTPYTFLEMEGERYKVIIDLGSTSMINLPENSKFAKAVRANIELEDNTRNRYTLGGLQEITEKVGTIPEIKLGSFSLEDVTVSINETSQPRIGMKFFQDFAIYIDNANGGVYRLKRLQ
ncbi:MAG: hypothetical protein AAGH79_17240 [Bacteroidota bacterium]